MIAHNRLSAYQSIPLCCSCFDEGEGARKSRMEVVDKEKEKKEKT